MDLVQTIILGIVEGATEFVPVSSTGHLILASSLLGIPQTEFVKTFEIAIQSGAILAVVALYWKSFLNWPLIQKIIAAFIPTGIIGLALHSYVKAHLLGNEMVVLSALAVGGLALIAFELWHEEHEGTKDITSLSYTNAVLIGIAQAIAIIPGVSRSAATIVGGLALGLSRAAIIEFSFLLAVPTMAAATGLDLLKTSIAFTGYEWFLLSVGFVVSFLVALAAIRWLLHFVRGHSFIPFGIYRIVLSLVFALYLFR
ncbi:MAG TPA: undecaprenyl-diphosphate phosphatase [Candidatus Paceibacterota bacterium]|nr:undecaprenyl-diphosphate phosphatase [Candidatus Paceibacterota bacterium]